MVHLVEGHCAHRHIYHREIFTLEGRSQGAGQPNYAVGIDDIDHDHNHDER